MLLQICGRGKSNFDHTGNRRLRILIACDLPAYMQQNCRVKRSKILNHIVKKVHDAGGRFVRHNRESYHWHIIDEASSVRKVCHVINYGMHKSGTESGTPQTQIQALQNHLLWSSIHPQLTNRSLGPTSARTTAKGKRFPFADP